ncbi:MAG TPA: calcium/sodium antiporter [Kiritimatiellia bacterium]|nr:calcium/sodium antiporter [Kiritimatiellia bacterium]
MDLLTLAMLIGGFILLVWGAEQLIKGASRLAAGLGISPLVIGLTVVSYGTSAPELFISTISAWNGASELAFGNVVGSNIFNILFVLGVCALISAMDVDARLIRIDVPIMIGSSAVAWVMALNGVVSRGEGLLLAAGVVAYTLFCVRQSRKEENPAIQAEYEREYGLKARTRRQIAAQVTLCVVGLAMLVVGSKLLVVACVSIARWLGVSELVIGLTIVAAGTSLPEVATSVIAALRKERDIAVGNLVGSNIFNILSVLGFSALVAPDGIAAPPQSLAFDVPVMMAVSIACLPIFFTGYRISRWEGLVFLAYYVFYIVEQIVLGAEWSIAHRVMIGIACFVVPLTALTLGIGVYRSLRPQLARPTPF